MPRVLQIRVNVANPDPTANNTARFTFRRNQLYRMAFLRFCIEYARKVDRTQRKIIEFILLSLALFSFVAFAYLHIVFVQSPINCLEKYENEIKEAKILRVELLQRNAPVNYSLFDSYYKEHAVKLLEAGIDPCPKIQRLPTPEAIKYANESYGELEYDEDIVREIDLLNCRLNRSNIDKNIIVRFAEDLIVWWHSSKSPEEIHAMEYSLEYGFLKLSPTLRQSLNISVFFVALDVEESSCIGGGFNKFLLSKFLGYENVLLSSVRYIAERNDFKGYVRSVGNHMEYIFVPNNGWIRCYIVAFTMMICVTVSVTLLLRFAHQQTFAAMATLFDIFSTHQLRDINAGLIMTIILAVLGLQAVISAVFEDSALTLNILVIVWLSDFYNNICCHTLASKRHWYRFFLLYQYVFYAYNHRFRGIHWQLNMWTTWLFTLHSMIYFFHHFELPYHIDYSFRNVRLRRRLENVLSSLTFNNNHHASTNQNSFANTGNPENPPDPQVVLDHTVPVMVPAIEQGPENPDASSREIQVDVSSTNSEECPHPSSSAEDASADAIPEKSEEHSLIETLDENLTGDRNQGEVNVEGIISDSPESDNVSVPCSSDYETLENSQLSHLRKRT